VMPGGRSTAWHPCVLGAKADMAALIDNHLTRATSGRRCSKCGRARTANEGKEG
jgi:hypothetical protein